jgi:tRNA1Val (adenine37-N6)-methyltransferase
MSNNYFQFKQFKVQQDRCAMKVCTDSCLFGSLLPTENIKTVLDIGTGTGLLSLMYAQLNNHAEIIAVEIDKDAAKQAQENIENSIFKRQIKVIEKDFNEYKIAQQFDLIICNPPFYENDLPSTIENKNIAHHSTQLVITNFIKKAAFFLTNSGTIAILLPHKRLLEIKVLVKEFNLFVNGIYLVKQTPKHDYFRAVLFINKKEFHQQEFTLTIKNEEDYSTEFKKLLQPFYLNL